MTPKVCATNFLSLTFLSFGGSSKTMPVKSFTSITLGAHDTHGLGLGSVGTHSSLVCGGNLINY
jgi:hypothetical protein